MTLQVRVPGVTLALSLIESDAGYRRVSDVIQTVLSPFKPIFDLINIAIQIKETLEKAVDIPTDPAAFLEKLEDLTAAITNLSQYIPQLRVPVMIKDSIGVTIAMVDQLLVKASVMENILANKTKVEEAVYLDDNLQSVADLIQEQYNKEAEDLDEMMDPITDIIEILNVLGSLIGFTIPIPTVSSGGTIEDITTILEVLRDFLSRIYDNIP